MKALIMGAYPESERPSLRGSAELAPPIFRRSSSSLRRASIEVPEAGLDDAELDFCESFAIPISDMSVGARIGTGACGDVMRGVWRGRDVAIKTLAATGHDELGSAESKDMLMEIRLMCRSFATVRHPCIVGFYGICVDGPQPWLLLEYVGGGSVETYYNSEGGGAKPARKQALSWALDLARALEYLHSRQPAIVHRDVKPGNMLLTADLQTVKLCDFGVSTTLRGAKGDYCDCDGAADPPITSHQTETDTLYNDNVMSPSARPKEMSARTGTYRYMAPEVFAGQRVYSPAVDIYSAALSLWFLFHGQRPFPSLDGLTVAELASRQVLRPAISRKGKNKVMPSNVSDLLERSWRDDPAQRPTATDLVAELDEANKKEGMRMFAPMPFMSSFFGRVKSSPEAPTLPQVDEGIEMQSQPRCTRAESTGAVTSPPKAASTPLMPGVLGFTKFDRRVPNEESQGDATQAPAARTRCARRSASPPSPPLRDRAPSPSPPKYAAMPSTSSLFGRVKSVPDKLELPDDESRASATEPAFTRAGSSGHAARPWSPPLLHSPLHLSP